MRNVTLLKDMAERAAATWVQVFLGLLLAADATGLDWSVVKVAAAGAVPAALSVVKGWLASVLPVGDDSASLL